MLDRQITNAISMCVRFYRSNKTAVQSDYADNTLFVQLRTILENAFLGLSLTQEAAFPGWVAERENPGYLIKIDPPNFLRAPFFLVPTFPSGKELNQVFDISTFVKTNESSRLCISGSSTTRKVIPTINDIDFCEYIQFEHPTTAQQIATKVDCTSDVVFQELKFNGKAWARSVDKENVQEHLAYVDAEKENLSSAKIDYLIRSESFRPCAVSNVMIFCDSDWNSAGYTRTFSPQEAHLDISLNVPNQICDPFEVGRYVDWLFADATKQIESSNYLKAIKRLLSLSRIYFLPEVTELIRVFLQDSQEMVEQEIKEIDNVLQELRELNGSAYASWISDLVKEKQERIREREGWKKVANSDETIQAFVKTLERRLAAYCGNQSKAA